MKNSFAKLALISVASIGSLVAAQAPGDPPPAPAAHAQHHVDPQKQLNHLSKKLALTADQQNQILPVLTDRQAESSSIYSDATLTPQQRHEKMKALRSDSESKIRSVLTDTQRAAYDQMQQEARDRAHTRKLSVSN